MSRALAIVHSLQQSFAETPRAGVGKLLEDLAEILETIDARTGRRDPTKRPKRPKRR